MFLTINIWLFQQRVYQNETQSSYLARNVGIEYKNDDDPMMHVQALRSHLYTINVQIDLPENDQLQLFERMKMCDMLNEFVINYRNLLQCSSTPMPFALLQMGRTFLFLWTFTIPLVLRGVVDEIYAALVFVFFLTYGFIGLELVAMKLMNPFGDGVNDLNVIGMKEATIIGMEKDLKAFGESTKLTEKRLEYSRQKPRPPMTGAGYSHPHSTKGDISDGQDGLVYHGMGDILYPSHS